MLEGPLWTAWDWEPGIVIPLVVSAVLYLRGLRLLWNEHLGRGVRVWEATSFAAGWILRNGFKYSTEVRNRCASASLRFTSWLAPPVR